MVNFLFIFFYLKYKLLKIIVENENKNITQFKLKLLILFHSTCVLGPRTLPTITSYRITRTYGWINPYETLTIYIRSQANRITERRALYWWITAITINTTLGLAYARFVGCSTTTTYCWDHITEPSIATSAGLTILRQAYPRQNGHQQRELAPYSQQFMIWPTAPHRTAQLISTFLNILYRRRWNDSLVCKSIAFPAFQHRTSQSHKQFAWCFSHRCAMWSDAKDEKKHVRTHLYTTCGEKIHIHPVS